MMPFGLQSQTSGGGCFTSAGEPVPDEAIAEALESRAATVQQFETAAGV